MYDNMKKRLASVLAAVMLITALPVPALAAETDAPEPPAVSAAAETTAPETTETSATAAPETLETPATTATETRCGDNLTWTLVDGVLTISGTGDMWDWDWRSRIFTPWYENVSTIKTVRIGSGVTSIGSFAFNSCSSLTSVTIPGSVTSIGDHAFDSCSSLTGVTIPDSVTSIGIEVFSDCSSLTSVTIPDGVTRIWSAAFEGCSSLTSVTIPDSVTSIEAYAFKRCSSLTGVTIPNSVTSIGDYAFDGCSSLTSVTIPNSVTSIGNDVFYDCSSLTSVTIPDGVTSIGVSAFWGCRSLTSVTIPDGVISIGYSAFTYCTSLTSVTIPNSVTSIGNSAFSSCPGLTSMTIPDSVTSIGDFVFRHCTSLTSVTIPDGVTRIGNYTFYDCRSLTDVYYSGTQAQWNQINIDNTDNGNYYLLNATIHCSDGTINSKEDPPATDNKCGDNLTWTLVDGVLTISGTGDMWDWEITTPAPWHENASTIKTVRIGSGATNIGKYAFSGCSSLTSVTIPDSVTSIGDTAFGQCSSLTGVGIPDSVTSIGEDAFFNCISLTSVTIPDGVTSIGDNTFLGCTSLPSVTIPDSVTSIGDHAFDSCRSLTSVTIPDSVISIGKCAFGYCSSLTSITIPANVTEIKGNPFYADRRLSTVLVVADNTAYVSQDNVLYSKDMTTLIGYPDGKSESFFSIPEGVTSIGEDAFFGCSSLTSVTIPDSVTSIGASAFRGCSSLTSITIPDSVTSIGDNAFRDCSSLTSVTIPNSVTSIGVYTFSYCSNLSSVAIPDSVTSIGDFAFRGCSSLTSVTIPASVTRIWYSAFEGCSNLTDVYYSGTQAQWNQINIDNRENGNDPLLNATIHYNDEGTGEEPVSLNLTAGVKYVPYSWQPEASEGTYSVVAGTLPNGLSVNGETGEITGVPMVSGSWSFTVRHQNEDTVYTLTVEDNTNTAVQRPNDYTIVTPVGTPSPSDPNQFILYEYADRTLIIDGPYEEFMHLRIDGQLLTRDEDYTAREGSTVITIFGQTFEKFGEGTHTLSAEFRENKDPNGKLKTVSQNYTVTLTQPSKPSQPSSSGSSGSSSSNKRPSANLPKPVTPGTSGTSSTSSTPSSTPSTPSTTPSTPSTTPSTTPTAPDTAASEMPFGDVPVNAWYYEDVKWAYQEEILTGVSAESFAPAVSISQATIVTVLARLGKIDLTRFEGTSDDSITAGKWYTNAAVWAKQSGILPDYSEFTGEETISRDQMAIMLVKYLRSMGKDTTPPAQAAVFADADQMSPDGNQAFQVLYQYDIFKGVGNGYMDPNGSTTRAQFTALAHRLSEIAA